MPMEYWRIFISAPAEKVFMKFPERTRKEVEKELSLLRTNPFAGERLSGPLSFLYSYHFTVFGKYFRAAYTIDITQKKITLQYLGPRGNFYERLRRLLG